MKRKQKRKGGSVQSLLGVKSFSEYGLITAWGELLFFHVTPSNISVLSPANVEDKVRQLSVVLSSVDGVEIVCLDSTERFDDNKAHLIRSYEREQNPKVKELLKQDVAFLEEIQMEMATARRFMFIVRCKNLSPVQTFHRANGIQKILSNQGFDTHRFSKEEIKRFLALYFEASMFGEQMPDIDGAQYFQEEKS